MNAVEANLTFTHIGKENIPADTAFEYGPVFAVVDGNRVILTRANSRGDSVIISDETIPDELMPMVMDGLKPINRTA